MKSEERGPWYLLTGLVIGIVLGLVYAWVVQPVRYVNTSPGSLRVEFKDRYRALIAAAYLSNNDLVRARARLELLKDQDIYRALSEQAQRTLAQGGSSNEARALGLLAVALGRTPPGQAVAITQPQASATPVTIPRTKVASPTLPSTDTPTLFPTLAPTSAISETVADPSTAEIVQVAMAAATATPGISSTPTRTPIPSSTDTPIPTRVFTATPGGPFVMANRLQLCEQELPEPLIEIQATSLFGQPVPGIPVIIAYNGREEQFFTGLKPDRGLGYADFNPVPGVVYTIRLGEGGQPVSNLTALQCQRMGGGTFWGAWLLKFVQP